MLDFDEHIQTYFKHVVSNIVVSKSNNFIQLNIK
jgi:hypothetical protein